MSDATDNIRMAMVATDQPATDLEGHDGPTWDTQALQRDYEVLGFMAPFVVVRRRSDGVKGTLEFVHAPRVYFDFTPDEP